MGASVLKLLAIYLLRSLETILHIFPIKKNRIIFNSYSGRNYACSPRYISEYLAEQFPQKYELIWSFKNPEKFRYLEKKGIKVIKYASLKRFYYEATSKISINNIGSFSWLPKTKSQLRINTWHGGGCYKRVGLGEDHNDIIRKYTMWLSAENTSYMISSSRYSSEYVYPHDFGYTGNILDIGFPRNDIFFKNNDVSIKERVCAFYGLNPKCKIVLFAPTWRYNTVEEIVIPNFKHIKQACSKKFDGEWVVLFRAHELMLSKAEDDSFINATDYSDMQELLVAADLLISDYSSCIWDYSLKNSGMCLLFTPDLERYRSERGFDIDIEKWGFPVCVNDDELVESIINFDESVFRSKMLKHQTDLGSYESGSACEKLGKIIEEFCWR